MELIKNYSVNIMELCEIKEVRKGYRIVQDLDGKSARDMLVGVGLIVGEMVRSEGSKEGREGREEREGRKGETLVSIIRSIRRVVLITCVSILKWSVCMMYSL